MKIPQSYGPCVKPLMYKGISDLHSPYINAAIPCKQAGPAENHSAWTGRWGRARVHPSSIHTTGWCSRVETCNHNAALSSHETSSSIDLRRRSVYDDENITFSWLHNTQLHMIHNLVTLYCECSEIFWKPVGTYTKYFIIIRHNKQITKDTTMCIITYWYQIHLKGASPWHCTTQLVML